jgi:hypothetical protein
MPEFTGSSFHLRLPEGYTDVTTYAFVLPCKASFKPSIVLRSERHEGPIDLMRYMIQQRSALRESVKEFDIISEWSGRQGRYEAVTTVFEWKTQDNSLLRQAQRFVHRPELSLIYILTATDLADHYAEMQRDFDQVMDSFRPDDSLAL